MVDPVDVVGDGYGELEVVDAAPGWSWLRISSALKRGLKPSSSALS